MRGWAAAIALTGAVLWACSASAAHSPPQQAPAQHRLLVGGVENDGMFGATSAYMSMAKMANFQLIVLSSVWRHGRTTPDSQELGRLVSSARAARNAGIVPVIAVYSFAHDTPTTPGQRGDFVQYAATIEEAIPNLRYMSIGNEPNSTLFWRGGTRTAANAYYLLLAQAYDVLKVNNPRITVIGGSLASRHNAVNFIRDLGAAYRTSRRGRPFMDVFSLHPYPPNSGVPPTVGYGDYSTSIGIADYPRLVQLLASALGTVPPIAYGEYGIETRVPRGALSNYNGAQPHAVDAVTEARQADDYVAAIEMAACQPRVKMLLFFHVDDETSLRTGLQTGLFYPSGQPKQSLQPVSQAALEAENGKLKCGA